MYRPGHWLVSSFLQHALRIYLSNNELLTLDKEAAKPYCSAAISCFINMNKSKRKGAEGVRCEGQRSWISSPLERINCSNNHLLSKRMVCARLNFVLYFELQLWITLYWLKTIIIEYYLWAIANNWSTIKDEASHNSHQESEHNIYDDIGIGFWILIQSKKQFELRHSLSVKCNILVGSPDCPSSALQLSPYILMRCWMFICWSWLGLVIPWGFISPIDGARFISSSLLRII